MRPSSEFNFMGRKFTPRLPIKEIARLLRLEIKEEVPEVRATVRFYRYGGGQSLTVTLRRWPGGDPEPWCLRIRSLANEWNFHESGDMDDYHRNNFFLDVRPVSLWDTEEPT